jgi:hypothetical protein
VSKSESTGPWRNALAAHACSMMLSTIAFQGAVIVVLIECDRHHRKDDHPELEIGETWLVPGTKHAPQEQIECEGYVPDAEGRAPERDWQLLTPDAEVSDHTDDRRNGPNLTYRI